MKRKVRGKNTSYRTYRLSKYLAISYLGCLIIVSISADFLANDRPIVCWESSGNSYPIFSRAPHFDPNSCEKSTWPPIRHYIRPFENEYPHYLGQDFFGRDLLACLIHGTRYSLFVGVVSMLIAAGIGMVLGGFAGYFHDEIIKVGIGDILYLTLVFFTASFLAFFTNQYAPPSTYWGSIGGKLSIFLLAVFIAAVVWYLQLKPLLLGGRIQIPVGKLLTGFIQIVEALPALLLLIVCISWLSPPEARVGISQGSNIWVIILALGGLSWTGMARIIRSEFIKIKKLPYIESARALGFSPSRIIFFHILPNCLPLVAVIFLFSIGRAILAEASLSFLGIKPAQYVSWGELLRFESYEIMYQTPFLSLVLPVILIFLTVLSFFTLSNQFKNYSL